jgi:predicted ATPase/DNA-binding CsgD family transcriptional regulator
METSNLPTQPTPFVGRLEELHQISALINDPECRLLTLVGPGGIGKTRLAIEVVRQLNGSKRSYFVPLQPLNSPDLIVPALAEAIGLEFTAGTEPKEQMLDYLSRNSMLLLLDNFEHLLDAAPLVSDILTAAPSVKLLVTSRERLNLVEEWSFEVQGLNFPISASAAAVLETYSAVQLFVQRARRSQSDFSLTDTRKPAVIRICQLVGGMPLGIELAAVWVRALSCDEIADEIEHSLDILTTPARNVEPRHRAMRAVLEHSWKMLTDAEQQVFTKLSVFKGGFRKDAAQVVAGASLPTLSALVDKSLLRVSESGRYEIHELLRQYGEEHLDVSGETDNTRDAHALYFTDFLAQREQDIKGRRQIAALYEIDADFENIRAAWRWHLATKNYAALDSALETFRLYLEMRGPHADAIELLRSAHNQLTAEAAAEPSADLHVIKGRMQARLMWLDMWEGFSSESLAAMKPDAEELLAAARQQGDKAQIAYCLWLLGVLDVFADNFEAGLPWLEECLAVYTELDDPFYIARAADWLGGLLEGYGQTEAGVKLSQQSYDLRRAIGDRYGMTAALANLIDAALSAGRYDQAKRFAQEMGQHYQALGSGKWMTRATGYLSVASFQQGDFQTTRALAEETMEIIATGGLVGRGGMAYSFVMLGMLAALEEDYARCQELCERRGDHREVLPVHEEGLAVAACGLGDYPTAQHHFVTALVPAIISHDYRGMTIGLPVAAILLAHEGHPERAVEILGLAFHHPASAKIWMEQWPLLQRLRVDLLAVLSPQVFDAAWERGKESDLETEASALLGHFQSSDRPEKAATGTTHKVEAAPLTGRELEILGLMAQGMTNRDISEKLYLTVGTVKWYGSQICSKLHVHNRVQAIARARELNLLS